MAARRPTSPSSCRPATGLGQDRTCCAQESRHPIPRNPAPQFRYRPPSRRRHGRASCATGVWGRTTPSTRDLQPRADSASLGSARHRSRRWRSRSSGRVVSTFVPSVLVVLGGVLGRKRRRQGRRDVIGVRGNRAAGGVTAHFRIGEQRFMSLPVDRANGNEEAVPWTQAKSPGRDHLILAVAGNGDALPIEVFVYGTSSDDEVVYVASLGLIEFDADALHGVAAGGEVLW